MKQQDEAMKPQDQPTSQDDVDYDAERPSSIGGGGESSILFASRVSGHPG